MAALTPTALPTVAPEKQWNRANLDALTNGNVDLAVERIATTGVPTGKKLSAESTGQAPWEHVGEVYEVSGLVGRVREDAVNGPEPTRSTSRRSLSEVVLFESPDTGIMPIECLLVESAGTLRQGDQVSVTGYITGVTDLENQAGDTTTGLVIVGQITMLHS
jgi:hypothetical protein